MTIELLPHAFDELVRRAIRTFWHSRSAGVVNERQGSGRASILGKNMDGFVEIVRSVIDHCGLPANTVHVRKSKVILPGFFRASRDWDVVVIHEGRLLGVFEFDSQVKSFGNNFDSRSEEVIGSATDFWLAHHRGAFTGVPRGSAVQESNPAVLDRTIQSDPRPPFLAWLMLLEDCAASRRPVKFEEPHFPVFEEFRDASYARRYQILCERLVERQLCSAAALVLTPTGKDTLRSLSSATSIRNLFAEFAGRVLAAAQ